MFDPAPGSGRSWLTTAVFVLKVWLAATADLQVALGIVAVTGIAELAASLLMLLVPVAAWTPRRSLAC
jgi:hypothetical protein